MSRCCGPRLVSHCVALMFTAARGKVRPNGTVVLFGFVGFGLRMAQTVLRSSMYGYPLPEIPPVVQVVILCAMGVRWPDA